MMMFARSASARAGLRRRWRPCAPSADCRGSRTRCAGSAFRSTPSRSRSRLHRRRGAVAGARRGLEQRDLFADQRNRAASVASRRPGGAHIAQTMEQDRANLRSRIRSSSAPAHCSPAAPSSPHRAASSSCSSRHEGVGGATPPNPPAATGGRRLLGTLRQRAQIGRLLGPDDNRTVGQQPVAVISDRYWSRRFGRSDACWTRS